MTTEMYVSWCHVQIVRFYADSLSMSASLCMWKDGWQAEIARHNSPYYIKERDMVEEVFGSLEEVSQWLADKLAEYGIQWGACR